MYMLKLISVLGFSADITKAKEAWKGSESGNILTDHAASYIAGIAMEGAADTTSNTMAGLIKVRSRSERSTFPSPQPKLVPNFRP